jgi:hypothetical protein
VTTRVTLAEQIAEVEREITLRRRVYPGWIAAGKLSQALADRQMACIEATRTTLKWVEKNAAAIKAAASR